MQERRGDFVLLDTGVLLKFFLGEEGADNVKGLLIKIASGKQTGFISVVTLSEIVTICIRREKEYLIPTILEFTHQQFKIIDITSEIAILSGHFKAKYSKGQRNLSHADSMILACSFMYGCTLLTYDPEFDDVGEVEVMTPERFLWIADWF